MASILVLGVALGLQEGGKKIKMKREKRKAKKTALAAEACVPAESCSSGAVPRNSIPRESRSERKSDEARREKQRRSFVSERAHKEDMPPTYQEAVRDAQRRA